MDRIPVLDVELRKVTCFKPGGNDFSTNQARRPAWPEIPGENTDLSVKKYINIRDLSQYKAKPKT